MIGQTTSGARSMIPFRAVICALAAVLAVPAALTPAVAEAAPVPAVGECFLISDAQSLASGWPGTTAVPCASRHSVEVTRSGRLPADANAVTFAQQACDFPSVYSDLGINQAVDAVVRRPIRIEALSFVVGGSVPASYVCAAGPAAFRGARGTVLSTMSSAIGDLTTGQAAALRFCNSAARGRDAFAPPITVPCTTRPRWQVTRWILWSDLYSQYPGDAVLASRARLLCGPRAVFSLPSSDRWATGSRRSFCYVKRP
jgi:hypothetical protein